jgi:hypothetical protein
MTHSLGNRGGLQMRIRVRERDALATASGTPATVRVDLLVRVEFQALDGTGF